jgi:uncharacterized membrane protein
MIDAWRLPEGGSQINESMGARRSGRIERAKARHQHRSAGKVLAVVCGDWSDRQYGNQAFFATEASCIAIHD